jgi:hypothetical protein
MLDRLQRFAHALRILLVPSMVLGFVCLVLIVVAIFSGGSTEGHRYIMPGFVGLVWAIATFSFIATFSEVPPRAAKSDRLLAKLRRSLCRAWYWLVALVFMFTSASALVLTGRLISIWLKDSAG